MITLSKLKIAMSLFLATACSDGANVSAMERLSPSELGHAIVDEMTQLVPSTTQCDSPTPLGEDQLLVVVSREVCLGCLNLGWFIREFKRTIHGNVTVVAARSIDDLACDFVVREKTGATLALVRDDVLVRWQPRDLPVVLDVANDGTMRRAFASNDLTELLSLLEDGADSLSTRSWR